jgi:hypothetical protein
VLQGRSIGESKGRAATRPLKTNNTAHLQQRQTSKPER